MVHFTFTKEIQLVSLNNTIMKKRNILYSIMASCILTITCLSLEARSTASISAIDGDKYVCSSGGKICVSVEMANGAIVDFFEPNVIIV